MQHYQITSLIMAVVFHCVYHTNAQHYIRPLFHVSVCSHTAQISKDAKFKNLYQEIHIEAMLKDLRSQRERYLILRLNIAIFYRIQTCEILWVWKSRLELQTICIFFFFFWSNSAQVILAEQVEVFFLMLDENVKTQNNK